MRQLLKEGFIQTTIELKTENISNQRPVQKKMDQQDQTLIEKNSTT